MCSLYLSVRFLLVCPMYPLLHVLHISLYIPLLSWSCALSCNLGLIICRIVFVFLKAIFMLVCLNRLVIFLIIGLWYVNIAHLFSVWFVFKFLLFFWVICVFNCSIWCAGNLLLLAMVFNRQLITIFLYYNF